MKLKSEVAEIRSTPQITKSKIPKKINKTFHMESEKPKSRQRSSSAEKIRVHDRLHQIKPYKAKGKDNNDSD
jgi:hypothetical protein